MNVSIDETCLDISIFEQFKDIYFGTEGVYNKLAKTLFFPPKKGEILMLSVQFLFVSFFILVPSQTCMPVYLCQTLKPYYR